MRKTGFPSGSPHSSIASRLPPARRTFSPKTCLHTLHPSSSTFPGNAIRLATGVFWITKKNV